MQMRNADLLTESPVSLQFLNRNFGLNQLPFRGIFEAVFQNWLTLWEFRFF
jgi:hypothetical protein